jgi:hypothetical protein
LEPPDLDDPLVKLDLDPPDLDDPLVKLDLDPPDLEDPFVKLDPPFDLDDPLETGHAHGTYSTGLQGS